MKKLILGIETSCDETGLALVEASGNLTSGPKFKILKNLVASQVKIHAPFGGVVPNLAKREHLKNLPILLGQIFENSKFDRARHRLTKSRRAGARNSKQVRKSKFKIQNVDLIAVTVGPGLEPALWTGITFAKELGKEIKNQRLKIEIIGANHLEGHLYSFLLPKKTESTKHEIRNSKRELASDFGFRISDLFPAVALIVSGGHTVLLLMKDLKTWKELGETRDDAVGEAFDKVARLLNLPYPGGPALEKLARSGNPKAIEFPRPMIHEKSYDFSFSGLKTSVLYFLRDYKAGKFPSLALSPTSTANSAFWPALTGRKAPDQKAGGLREHPIGSRSRNFPAKISLADVAASFQAAAVEVLVKKTLRAAREFSAKSVMLSGGVAANKKLRGELKQATLLRQGFGGQAKNGGMNFLVADQKYNTDNAVMIAAAGYMAYLRKKKYPLRANGNLGI